MNGFRLDLFTDEIKKKEDTLNMENALIYQHDTHFQVFQLKDYL